MTPLAKSDDGWRFKRNGAGKRGLSQSSKAEVSMKLKPVVHKRSGSTFLECFNAVAEARLQVSAFQATKKLMEPRNEKRQKDSPGLSRVAWAGRPM